MIKIKRRGPPPPSRRRKPGHRADLTRAAIVAKALELLEKDPSLTMAAIAKALGVVPGAIYAHFPGSLPEIHTEMVRTVLTNVAPPFKPRESWEDYIWNLFEALLNVFQKHRTLAPIFARELSANYYLNSLLVERILVALELAGLSEAKRAEALDLVMGSLVGLVTIESPGLSCFASSTEWLQDQSATIDALPAGEHPQIKTLKGRLLEAAKKRSTQKHPPSTVQRFADLLIAGLKAQASAA